MIQPNTYSLKLAIAPFKGKRFARTLILWNSFHSFHNDKSSHVKFGHESLLVKGLFPHVQPLRGIMRTATTQNKNTKVSEEIFSQLQASKVNGFPFFAYTGIKASIFSAESLYLKLPKNPSPFKSILVVYEYDSDTYKVQFYTHDEVLKEKDIHTDIYADGLAELIVREMGVN